MKNTGRFSVKEVIGSCGVSELTHLSNEQEEVRCPCLPTQVHQLECPAAAGLIRELTVVFISMLLSFSKAHQVESLHLLCKEQYLPVHTQIIKR